MTHYNAYIKALPPAERAGVADVQYFKDGDGQNAVAAMANADDKQWLHVLVHDMPRALDACRAERGE